MKKFEEPIFEVLNIASPDVITTSGDIGGLMIFSDGYTNNNTMTGGSLDSLFI